MKLHSLRLTGFKTFGQETQIAFNPGISAIVGPNGSGKSNVVDAIAWVLGEQSPSSLRIKRANELIFQPPDGNTARNMTSVELSIQEADRSLPVVSSELSIARTGYRDGESDFYLNGGRTLRKHIRALFAPYGMAQRTFSVVRQGHTDLLLDVSPHNRLRVIQEAAGVLGLIQQKEESLRRLERTQEQLAPVRQELRELQLSMTHLERQAQQFERRQTLLAELQQVIGPYYRHHCSTLEKEMATQGTNLEQACKELATLEAACQANRTAQAELRDRYRQSASQLEILQARIQATEQASQLMLRQRDVLAERQHQHRAQLAALGQSQTKWRQRHDEITAERAQNRTQRQTLEAKVSTEQQAVTHKRDVLERLRAQRNRQMQQLQAARQQFNALEQRITALTRKHTQQTLDTQLAAQTVKTQADTEHNLQVQGEELARLQQSQAQHWQDLATRQQHAQAAVTAARHQTDLHAEQVASLQQQHNALERSRAELAARKDSWEEYLAARMQHLGPVTADQPDDGEILGILGSLLVVPPRYQEPVAVCLGEWIHGLVFQNWDDACTVLRPAEAGSSRQVMRVAALDRLPSRARPPVHHHELEHLCTAIAYPPALEALMQVLLADWYVVASTAQALEYISACTPDSPLHLVSLAGDRFPGPGLMQLHGADAVDTQLLKMQHEVQTLDASLHDVNQHLEVCTRKLDETTRLLELSRDNLLQCQEQLVAVDMAVKQSRQERAELARQRKDVLAQLEQLRTDQTRNRTHLQELQQAAKANQALLATLHTERDDCRQTTTALEQALAEQEDDSLVQELEAARLALQTREQELANLQARELQLSRSQQALQQDLESGRQQVSALEDEETAAGHEIARLTQALATASRTLDQEQRELVPLAQTTHRFVHEQQDLDQVYEGLMSDLRAAEARVHQLRFALAQLEERKVQLESGLHADWELMGADTSSGMTGPDLLARLPSTLTSGPGQAESEVVSSTVLAALRRRLARSGPVQEDVYRAYQDAGSRSGLLETQLADLSAAEEQLRDIVQRLDEQLWRKTHRALHEINQNFSDYFARFFPGGQAWLEMTDAQDGILPGVELYLQLPGKHVQHVAALSGGERAMSALAFICSMLKFNQPPFCVLDEIDAPLDETNVNRIGTALRELAQRTQLILITHNHRMLEYTDAIWGVTLNGAGCSQVLSMRLDHSIQWLETQGQLPHA